VIDSYLAAIKDNKPQ